MFNFDDLMIGKKTGLFAMVLILIGFGFYFP
jgi:hypothetical protein